MEEQKKRKVEQAKLDAIEEVKKRASLKASALKKTNSSSESTTKGRKNLSKRAATLDNNDTPSKKQVVTPSEDNILEEKNSEAQKPANRVMKLRSRSLSKAPATTPQINEVEQISMNSTFQSPVQQDISVRLSPMEDRRLSGAGSFRGSASNPLTGGGGMPPPDRVDAGSRDRHSRRMDKIHGSKPSSQWQLLAHDPSLISGGITEKTTQPKSPGLADVVIEAIKHPRKQQEEKPKPNPAKRRGVTRDEKYGYGVAQKEVVQADTEVEKSADGGITLGCWLWLLLILLLLLLLLGLYLKFFGIAAGGVCFETSGDDPRATKPSGCWRMTACPAHGRCRSGTLNSCMEPFEPAENDTVCAMQKDYMPKIQSYLDFLRNTTAESICAEVYSVGKMQKVNYTLSELQEATGLKPPENVTSAHFEEMTETFELVGKNSFALSWQEVSKLNLPPTCAVTFHTRNNMLVIALSFLLAELVIWLAFC
mmetsp:Transcript_5522/g.7603  ORF Transcript_5522/g.7603 Transcript_5522/m.7603 type:complete len:480 (+) Transcript_5522:121-1560(+)|eukprot:CAMPEP_0117757872 /NCGR_PEP_ID=MMETSP0947-20121206/15014_1 /TAXON_ID=44440 /ORGANISM="Chattonella subsalsa, Strain CCMP2191" /LENGTH=479 /DNA_ID=CAMNT_0005577897 /DNA_START=103 /DNA_END=1542 /DNA_ORIENTATION=-